MSSKKAELLMVSVTLAWGASYLTHSTRTFDPNGVGAPRREAHPRPPVGQKNRPAVLRRLRACFLSEFLGK